jgi:glycosyltransferase involved in cell wall biosynthesis
MWRDIVPFRAFDKAHGPHTAKLLFIEPWANRAPEAMELSKWADIIHVQRNAFGNVMITILYWRSRGKTVILDLDDGYDVMTEATGCPSYGFWHKGDMMQGDKKVQLQPTPLVQLHWSAGMVDGISSPSRVIAEDWKPYTKSYYVPNYYDPAIYKVRKLPPKDPKKIYIGWGGSMTHLLSWQKSGISIAANTIAKRYSNVIFVTCGDARVQNMIDVPPSRKLLVPWVSYALWGQSLAWFDIGVIPLWGEYDRRRSFIKMLEYGTMGIPWVGSNLDPNWDETLTPCGKLVENMPGPWIDGIEDMLRNYTQYKEKAEANKAEAEKFRIDRNLDTLVGIYQRMIDGED